MKYFINTFSNVEGYIVADDGTYIEWVFPANYVKKQYNWKALCRREWWLENVVEVDKAEFYSRVDEAVTKAGWKNKRDVSNPGK